MISSWQRYRHHRVRSLQQGKTEHFRMKRILGLKKRRADKAEKERRKEFVMAALPLLIGLESNLKYRRLFLICTLIPIVLFSSISIANGGQDFWPIFFASSFILIVFLLTRSFWEKEAISSFKRRYPKQALIVFGESKTVL